jgi:hypothetical protein
MSKEYDDDFPSVWEENDEYRFVDRSNEMFKLPDSLINNFLFYLSNVHNSILNMLNPQMVGKWVAVFNNSFHLLNGCKDMDQAFKKAEEDNCPAGTLILKYAQTETILEHFNVSTYDSDSSTNLVLVNLKIEQVCASLFKI